MLRSVSRLVHSVELNQQCSFSGSRSGFRGVCIRRQTLEFRHLSWTEKTLPPTRLLLRRNVNILQGFFIFFRRWILVSRRVRNCSVDPEARRGNLNQQGFSTTHLARCDESLCPMGVSAPRTHPVHSIGLSDPGVCVHGCAGCVQLESLVELVSKALHIKFATPSKPACKELEKLDCAKCSVFLSSTKSVESEKLLPSENQAVVWKKG